MEVDVEFLYYVGKWANNLCDMIEKIRRKDAEPILIALSRKMPRFIEWIINTRANNTLSPNVVKTIAKTELTTELSLPFIFFQTKSASNKEFIIVDDIIIHGTTIKNVVKDIVLLVGDRCHLSCMFRLEPTEALPFIGLFEIARIPSITQIEADKYIEIIANIVEETQLPIDMEFPIFDIGNENGYDFGEIEKDLSDIGMETYYIGKNKDRFSVNLPNPQIIGRDNDFSKIRCFKKHDKTIIETISPHRLSNQALQSLSIDSRLFEDNSFYQAIWDKTTLKVRRCLSEPKSGYEGPWEDLKSNFTRSLCVWANYLYSLSTFVFYQYIIKTKFHKEIFKGANIDKKELKLILGIELTDIIITSLEVICISFDFVRSKRDSVLNLPNSFSPEAYKTDWERNTIIACLVSETVDKALISIFAYQHYANPKFKNPSLNKERLFFGESYKSLQENICPYFSSSDCLTSIHKWVDESIDGGYVVPKYEKVRTADGMYYWRRYFHSGIRRYSEVS